MLRPYRSEIPRCEIFAERLILRRSFISQRTRNKPRNRIDDQHRRKLPAAQNIVSDGNFFRGEMFGHTLIHSFISSTKKHNAIQLRKSPRRFLPEEFSRCRHQNNGRFWIVRSGLLGTAQAPAKKRFSRFEKRLRFEHHPFPPAKRPVIDAAVAILGEHTQVLYVDLDEVCLASAPEDAVIERACKEFRKNCNQIKPHCCCQSNVPTGFADNTMRSSRGLLALILYF